jgi:glyoxylase-like metal-dependent hydrolase (beta-lactamase superfamily II)
MKAIAEVQRFAPGAYYWETYSPEIKTDLSCAGWRDEEEAVLIDPMPLTMNALDIVVARVGRAAVLLTNGNHARGSSWYHQRLHLEVWAHRDAVPELKQEKVRTFADGDMLMAGLRAIHLPGSAAGETGFYTPENGGIVFMGDALVNMESLGGLAFLPDKYSKDPQQSRQSLRKLLDLNFEMMTFAHGKPIVRGAKEQVAKLLGEA